MKISLLLKEALLAFIGNVLYIISFIVPKNKKKWVVGGLLGEGYNDNSKYFFEYLNAEQDSITAVWITQNHKVLENIRQEGHLAYHGYSVKGMWFMMRAGVAVISHSRVRDLKPFVFTPSVRLVQLWHGIPLKKIEFDDTIYFNKPLFTNELKFLAMRIISPGFRRQFDMFISCSEEDRKHFSSAFRLSKDKIKVTGYPRNDVFMRKSVKDSARGTKKILYVPTFRGIEKSCFNLFERYGFDTGRMDRLLKKNNAMLLVKLHPYNQPSPQFLEQISQSDQILFYDEKDIYFSMSDYDILITDYSSIYFDFLLLDRPIIFAPFDFQDYMSNDRELYYTYEDVTPGATAYSWPDVEKEIESSLNYTDQYAMERQQVRDRFHKFQDSQSCDRVFKQILKLI